MHTSDWPDWMRRRRWSDEESISFVCMRLCVDANDDEYKRYSNRNDLWKKKKVAWKPFYSQWPLDIIQNCPCLSVPTFIVTNALHVMTLKLKVSRTLSAPYCCSIRVFFFNWTIKYFVISLSCEFCSFHAGRLSCMTATAKIVAICRALTEWMTIDWFLQWLQAKVMFQLYRHQSQTFVECIERI